MYQFTHIYDVMRYCEIANPKDNWKITNIMVNFNVKRDYILDFKSDNGFELELKTNHTNRKIN